MKIQSFLTSKASLALLGVAFFATTLPTLAQESPAAPAAPANPEVVQMSAFEVRTTQGTGYTEGNAATALKSSESVMDIPQQVIVISNDLVQDLGAALPASDMIQYAGASGYFKGETVMIRGNRVTDPYIDDAYEGTAYADDCYVDTYEILKGPVQMFYPGSSLGGLVLKTTKKPLPYAQYSVTASVTQYGGERVVYDFTGPIGKFGEGTLTYRLVGAFQGGDQYYQNLDHRSVAVFPSAEYDWNGTKVLLQYIYQDFTREPAGESLLTPNGGLYTGAGRTEGGFPENVMDTYHRGDVRGQLIQKFSENWEMKLQGSVYTVRRYGATDFPTAVNWNTNQITYTPRFDDQNEHDAFVQDDAVGKYSLGPISTKSLAGFYFYDRSYISIYPTMPATLLPIGSAAAINALNVPQIPAYFPLAANPGTRTRVLVQQAYFMQQIDVLPNWLTLVGGFTYSDTETITDTNIGFSQPYASTDIAGHALMHRIGALLHVTKDVMLYAMESTTYSVNTGILYSGVPLPNVQGRDDETGVKTNFMDGRLSSTFSAYKLVLTNQSILGTAPLLNPQGLNYYIPIGTTTSHGWDADISYTMVPGWQIMGTGYVGTVRDQNNNPVGATYENQWSFVTRYDFQPGSSLRGFGIGTAMNRRGGRWLSESGQTLPGNAPLPTNTSNTHLFKLHEGTDWLAFATYDFLRHWQVRVSVENILNNAYPDGAQGVGLVDPSDPRTFSFAATFKW